tara:strand:+ start:78 stop:182 length:105 start_codon:yes stop_codon:yes gene_type:complete
MSVTPVEVKDVMTVITVGVVMAPTVKSVNVWENR